MKKKNLMTMTLECIPDNPEWSLCPGHVDVATFQKAHENEGWSGGGDIDFRDLKYEYWVKTKTGYKRVEAGTKGAKPFTVMEW